MVMAILRQCLILVFLVNLRVVAAPLSDNEKLNKIDKTNISQVIQDLNTTIKNTNYRRKVNFHKIFHVQSMFTK